MTVSRSPLVMLIDDNDIDLLLNKKFLHLAGISDNTVSFLSAKEALKYLEENIGQPDKQPSFVLLDIMMPEITGFQMVEALKEKPELLSSETKIFLLSSTTDPIDIEKAVSDERVHDILLKPLDPAKLKMALFAESPSR